MQIILTTHNNGCAATKSHMHMTKTLAVQYFHMELCKQHRQLEPF